MNQLAELSFPRRRVPSRFAEGWPSLLTALGVATALAAPAVALGWRGADLPAQVFRYDQVRRDGFVVWNSQWFGGQPTLSYSVIAPLIGAITGPIVLGVACSLTAAVLFARILHVAFGRTMWTGVLLFAAGTVTNLIVGRVTFALGLALGLAAVHALQRGRAALAVAAALLCALASPLAGVFLGIVAFAWAASAAEVRPAAIAMGIGAVGPVAVVGLLFGSTGFQPYEPWALVWDVSLCVVVFLAARERPALRWGAATYALAAAVAFVVPTPLGGNVSRFGQYVGAPLLACLLLPRRRLLFAALAVPLLVWQWYPAIDGIAYAPDDPSAKASYHTPVIDFLTSQGGPIGRVEIAQTYRHWEAAYAAPHVPLARGWERQADIAYASLFYEGELTAGRYEDWIRANGVRFVALPDARLDDSSLGERALLEQGLPFLREVWRNPHWRVWEVKGFTGLTSPNATLIAFTHNGFTLQVHESGDVAVQVRPARRWSVEGQGCATTTDDGWTQLRRLPVGTVEVRQSLTGERCTGT